ncbi:MAG: hypothetical protein L3J95_04665 [Thermoplasmata archaeon]|nr:hypothetical protein [Thermoplasmata archaeon]MCI4359698.1 hypothetical protein [Thermoplasmata archaeon]
MEGRKLQLAGRSTFLVSLPKRWVVDAGLKAGDTLFVEREQDGSVSVRHRTDERPKIRRRIFQVSGEEARDHLLRKLIGAYVSGFGLIDLRFPPERGVFVRRVAREFCRLVIGSEVIEETRGGIIIQDLSDTTELSSEKCLRRMHLTVRSMLEDSVHALKTASGQLAHEVAQRDQDVDRLYWMVVKQYHRNYTADQPPGAIASLRGVSHVHLLVAKLLERIGDHAERIAGSFPTITVGGPLEPKLAKELEEADAFGIGMLDRAFHALVTGDIDSANEVIDSQAQHQKMVDALSHRVAVKKGEELLALGLVVNSLSRTGSYAADIAEQAINLAILSEPQAT